MCGRKGEAQEWKRHARTRPVLSARIQVHHLWNLHSCRRTSVSSISREADTEWCTYQCQGINPAVSLSCCYQFMSCENEMVTWADHRCWRWLYTLLRRCKVVWFPYCWARFEYTDSNKKEACGSSRRFFSIHQGNADSWFDGFLLNVQLELVTDIAFSSR